MQYKSLSCTARLISYSLVGVIFGALIDTGVLHLILDMHFVRGFPSFLPMHSLGIGLFQRFVVQHFYIPKSMATSASSVCFCTGLVACVVICIPVLLYLHVYLACVLFVNIACMRWVNGY